MYHNVVSCCVLYHPDSVSTVWKASCSQKVQSDTSDVTLCWRCRLIGSGRSYDEEEEVGLYHMVVEQAHWACSQECAVWVRLHESVLCVWGCIEHVNQSLTWTHSITGAKSKGHFIQLSGTRMQFV